MDDGESVSDGSEALPVPHRAVMSNRPRGSDDDERWEDASSEGSAADGFGCENYDFEMDGSVCSSPNHMSEDDERPPAASQVRFHSGEASAVVLSDSLEVIEEAYRGPEWARMELLRRQAALMSKLPPLRSPVSNHAGSNTENDKIDFLRPVGGVDDSRALRSSGKILRPFTREDPFQPIQKRNGALKKLWEGSASGATRNDVGLVETREDDDIAVIRGTPAEDENEKIERLKHMNHRLGLVAFESNANEFDSSGIPKYGQDLSDDDVDLQLLRSAYSGDITWGGDGQVRLPKGCIKASELAKSCNFVAYDHEMDKSSSDQDA